MPRRRLAVSRPSPPSRKWAVFFGPHSAFAAGCSSRSSSERAAASVGQSTARAPAIIAVDDLGDTVRLATPATRIVSLIPATTELLFALGLGDRVVGRTTWCDYPAAARAVPSLGDGLQPNLEAIVAARPDLVVLYNSVQNVAAADRLRAQRIPTVLVTTDRLADVPRLARLLAPLGGRAGAGDSLARRFEAALDSATATGRARMRNAARPRVGPAADRDRGGQLPQRTGRTGRRDGTSSTTWPPPPHR